MTRVYIHEVVEVDGTRRSEYQQHMTANWVPEAAALRHQRCFGVFTLVGSTGAWPRVVNIWEYDSWHDLAHNFEVELSAPTHRDPMLEQWWLAAAEFRRGGHDRILVGHERSPGVEHWQSLGGTAAVAYVHEVITVEPGLASDVAGAVLDHVGGAPGPSLEIVGLWRTAMRAHDEVIVLRALPDWPTWAAYEQAQDAPQGRSVAGVDLGSVVALERTLLVDAPLSPLRIGRQPSESDRRALGADPLA